MKETIIKRKWTMQRRYGWTHWTSWLPESTRASAISSPVSTVWERWTFTHQKTKRTTVSMGSESVWSSETVSHCRSCRHIVRVAGRGVSQLSSTWWLCRILHAVPSDVLMKSIRVWIQPMKERCLNWLYRLCAGRTLHSTSYSHPSSFLTWSMLITWRCCVWPMDPKWWTTRSGTLQTSSAGAGRWMTKTNSRKLDWTSLNVIGLCRMHFLIVYAHYSQILLYFDAILISKC